MVSYWVYPQISRDRNRLDGYVFIAPISIQVLASNLINFLIKLKFPFFLDYCLFY
jgi:hypothetical protein